MFKLLILIGSFSAIPIHQTYQAYQHVNAINKTISELKNKIEKPTSDTTFGSGGEVGRAATFDEIAKFDYLVPNWQWFTKLRSYEGIGYTDLDSNFGTSGIGLCEYISMSMLLQYQELFVSSGFFTNDEWNKWFDNSKSIFSINPPKHNYYDGSNSSEGLVKALYRTFNMKDLKLAVDVSRVLNKFLSGKEIQKSIWEARSTSWMHSSHPSDYIKKEGVPVMFSFTSPIAHNVVIYGYNSRTDELAFHHGWPGSTGEYSMRIVKQSSIWSYWSFGFWNTFLIPKNTNKNAPRKAFEYQSVKYSWSELQAKGKSWNNVNPL